MSGDDLEAAFVNYVRAGSIVEKIMPQHYGWRDLDEMRTLEAQDYWELRNVRP